MARIDAAKPVKLASSLTMCPDQTNLVNPQMSTAYISVDLKPVFTLVD